MEQTTILHGGLAGHAQLTPQHRLRLRLVHLAASHPLPTCSHGLVPSLRPNQWTRLGLPTAIAQHWKELWKLANDESNDLAFYLEMIQCLVTERELPWSKVQPWLADRRAPKGLSLMKVFLQHDMQDQPAELRALWQRQLESFAASMDWPREKLDPPPLLDGSDLKNLGLKPGRAFSSILSKIRDLQLDQQLQGEARRWTGLSPTPAPNRNGVPSESYSFCWVIPFPGIGLPEPI